MKKNTKSLWIYAAVLLTIAIALIFITTLTQAQLVEHDGDFEVLGTFVQTSKENMSRVTNDNIKLTNENIELTDANTELTNENTALVEENTDLKVTITTLEANAAAIEQARLLSANILSAYIAEDEELLETLLATTTPELLDAFMPGLYTHASDLLSAQ